MKKRCVQLSMIRHVIRVIDIDIDLTRNVLSVCLT